MERGNKLSPVKRLLLYYVENSPPPPPPMAQQPPVGQDILIIDASRSHWHTTIGRTPLDEWSLRRRDLCLTTHNTHKKQTSMSPAGFEPAIPASERRQIHVLDRAATVTACWNFIAAKYCCKERLGQLNEEHFVFCLECVLSNLFIYLRCLQFCLLL